MVFKNLYNVFQQSKKTKVYIKKEWISMKKKKVVNAIVSLAMAAAICVPTVLPNAANIPILSDVSLVQMIDADAASYTYTYYPKCKSSYTSFVDALRSVGVSDTSLSARKPIAALNGYSSYTGTAAQNTALLNKLKNGTLVKSSKIDNYSTPLSSGSSYFISPACATGSVLDTYQKGKNNGTNIHLWSKHGDKDQQFKAVLKSNGYYAFYNVNANNKVLDVSGGRVGNGVNIQLYDYNGTDSQLWRLIDAGNGYYYLQSKLNSSYYLDVTGASSGNGTNIELYKGNGTNAQKFKFLAVNPSSNNNNSSSNTATTTVAGLVNGNTYNKSGNVSVSNKAKENNPYYKNTGSRSSAAYNQVINQFNVASNSRYKRTSTATYCNIFAWDVMSAMNVQLPHWVKNNVPSTYGSGNELNANATYNWLKNYGSKYGWSSVSASTAQSRANKGYPTVAIWYNSSGASGHVAVVRPEGNGYKYSDSKGPVIAQAGGSNFNYGNISTGFGTSKMSKVMYYTHS